MSSEKQLKKMEDNETSQWQWQWQWQWEEERKIPIGGKWIEVPT